MVEQAAKIVGLTEIEARARLMRDGPNELARSDRRSPLRIALNVLREPMLILLLGGGVIYLLIGDLAEALTLLVFATLSVSITVVQETRTERVLEALRNLASPRALVMRDGIRKRIPGHEVVVGDCVILSEGDRIPADLDLAEIHDLLVDESLLTGESIPVRKLARAQAEQGVRQRAGGDDLPCAYSGSLVVRGAGVGIVFATGARSEMGKIGEILRTLQPEPPRLQAQTRRLVRVFAVFAGLTSLVVLFLYGMLRGSWLEGFLAAIAIGMSLIPEEFPVVLTVFLAMGAWRISHARVLTRHAAAIETLGSATILCTDKTGTLTENRMSVAELRAWRGSGCRLAEPTLADPMESDLPHDCRALAEIGVLASQPAPTDPMDRAFHALAPRLSAGFQEQLLQRVLLREYGLRPDLPVMSNVWSMGSETTSRMIALKGAPEAVAALCQLGKDDFALLQSAIDDMGRRGMRVLGVACGEFSGDMLPASQREMTLQFMGLVGFADPLRANVPAAVAECASAGVRVVMITGDYPATAKAIAAEAGIVDADTVVTGAELVGLDDAALAQRVASAGVFARILPEQKLRIVNAFKARGDIVVMTGDGVNDAPSLKAAHIGIAMGGRGTDVAREASSIVLLDDDFGSIVKAIRLGRRIYDNLRKAMGFIIAVHVPIAGLSVLPLLFGLPILLGPMHIAFLEMVIDPVCTLAFEAEADEEDVMRRRPRDPSAPLFSRHLIGWSLFQGAVTFGVTGALLVFALGSGMLENDLRALVFAALVISIIGLIVVNRSFSTSLKVAIIRPNPTLACVLLAVLLVLAGTLWWPPARNLFHFGPLHVDDLLLSIAASGLLLAFLELAKRLLRRLLSP